MKRARKKAAGKAGAAGRRKALSGRAVAGRRRASKLALPKAPAIHGEFTRRFPELDEAWDLIHEAGRRAGPLDEKTQRIVKLAIAIGAKQEGAAHSSVRKALAMGVTLEEMEQVVALAAGTLGLPASVAAYAWIHDVADKGKKGA